MAIVTRLIDKIDTVSILRRPDSQTPSMDFEKHWGQEKAYFIDITGRQAILVYWYAISLILKMEFL
jgi:hypothetical protein